MARPRTSAAGGLDDLRRPGTVTELLFLYECATLEPSQLRPIAERLGVTVQAVSHASRSLRGRGLVAIEDGRYRPTVEGVAWLHEGLSRLADDVGVRLDRLNIVRSTRAVALSPIAAGAPVSLQLIDGVLSAAPGGAGASRGVARRSASKGALVHVEKLRGIVPLAPATIAVRAISEEGLDDPRTPSQIRTQIRAGPGLVAAEGLEAYHLVRAATRAPIVRFAVPAACAEAARIGVPSTVFVLETGVPRLLAAWAGTDPPSLDVRPLGERRLRGHRTGGHRA
jgi:predicted transcriptional regulator